MNQNKIDDILVKFIDGNISTDENTSLKTWLEDEGNKEYFNDFIKINYLINSTHKFNYQSALTNFKKQIDSKKPKSNRFLVLKYAVAASILLLVSLTIVFNKKENVQILVSNEITIGTDKAVLTLADGLEIVLEKEEAYQANNFSSNGSELVYNTVENSNPEIAYNYLTVPRGGQFLVKLSDGTKVWLNSESKIKYPVTFKENQDRIVELIYGEGYFDVAPSTNHNGTKFKVSSKGQEVEVLGTEFNIKAYNNEQSVYTTLVEGKVGVSKGNTHKSLKPGVQAVLNIDNNTLTTEEIDVTAVIAWKNGLFIFEKEPLGEMMKTLSRWYNVTMIYKNIKKKDIIFSGILNRTNSINDLLNKLEKTGEVAFQVEGKTIFIK